MAKKASVQSAVEIAAEFRQELARLDGAAVETMLEAWQGVDAALLESMEEFAGRFPPGTALTPGQVVRMERYAALHAQLQVRLEAMERVASGTIGAGTQQAAALGAAQAVGQLESLGVGVGFNRLPEAAVENVASLARAGRPLAALLEPMYGQAAGGIIRELINGVALGLGPRVIARRMSQDGLTDGLNHLLLVTRDQYNRAHRTAALETYRRSGVVRGYVRRCARQVGRTCIACVALDGIFYRLDQPFEEHPQGRCAMIPAVEGVDLKPAGSGKEWFKSLPEEQQKVVMGPARWEQYQAGELKWHQMVRKRTDPVWGTSVTPMPVGYQRKVLGPRKAKKALVADPEPVDVVDDPFPKGVDGLETVRGLGGSTGATLVRDPATGRQYVMKRGASAEHLRREVTADEMYRALGQRVPAARLYETDKGPVKLAEFVEGKTLRELRDSGKLTPATLRELQDGFAADALLGNRDVIGEAFDNILIDGEGRPWRIDNGGSLDFRAQGGAKAYDRWPMELWSMRDARVNRQTAAIFGDMQYSDLMESARALGLNGGAAAEFLPAQLREAYAGRLGQLGEAVRQYDELVGDGWRTSYPDQFTYFGFRMEQGGLFGKLPRRLTNRGVQVYDENKLPFDHLRGPDSVMFDVRQFINENGGDYGMVEYYMRGQAGSSWSSGSLSLKHYLTQQMDIDEAQVYWNDRKEAKRQYEATIKRFGAEKYQNTWQAFHAFNYNSLKRMEFAGNDLNRGALRLIRTEDADILRSNGLERGQRNATMPRGLAESASIFEPVTVYGMEETVQFVPHSRIIGHYFYERTPGSSMAAFHSDRENEFVFIPYGIPFDWTRKVR